MSKRKNKGIFKKTWDDIGDSPAMSMAAGMVLVLLIVLKYLGKINWTWFIIMMLIVFFIAGYFYEQRGGKK